jgi:hypothetical protein
MAQICLSYRRSDSNAITGRIHDHLVHRYGADTVFMDIGGIPYGADFREHIQGVFAGARVLIAVIGPEWLGQHAGGDARIHEQVDPVRVEIQTALSQQIFVLPVLVDKAEMPAPEKLPNAIKAFAYRNALRVDSGVDFHFHMERLIASVDQALGIEKSGKPAEKTAADGKPQPVLAKRATASAREIYSPAKLRLSRLSAYFLVTVVILLVAHYLIVMKLDLDPIYLRVAAIIVPAGCGFLLFRNMRLGVGPTAALGLAVAIVAVAGMTTIVGLVDGHSILPSGTAEWQEAFEYVATIALAAAAGGLLARLVVAMLAGRSQFF